MDYHLDRKLRLNTKPEFSSLYPWSINEVSADEETVGPDYSPWYWSLFFTATSCVIQDRIELDADHPPEAPEEPKCTGFSTGQTIQLALRPGRPEDTDDFYLQTAYSMFGTDRNVAEFSLVIGSLARANDQAVCGVSGIVSFTYENADFISETTDDFLEFNLQVTPEVFSRYMDQFRRGLVDEVVFRVSKVDGFYSQWSPTITTSKVKVLTAYKEHDIETPAEAEISPPRLGNIGEASLFLNRRLEFEQRRPDAEVLEEEPDSDWLFSETQDADAQSHIANKFHIGALVSLTRAAWLIVLLLAFVLLAILSG